MHLTIVQRMIVARTNCQWNLCSWVNKLMPRKRKMMQSLRRQKMTLDLSKDVRYLDLAIVLVAWFTVT